MKVGSILTVDELPTDIFSGTGTGSGKWAPVRSKLAELKDGEWLSVECADEKELIRLRNATASSNSKFRAIKRGLVLYYTRKNTASISEP